MDDFSAARNFALSKSNGNWILYLDADEQLNPDSVRELKTIINKQDKLGVNCTVTNLDDYSGNVRKMNYIRLFRNADKIHFEGKAHEQIQNSLVKSGYKIVQSKIEIVHHGYNLPKEELKHKAGRNLKLLLSDYEIKKNSYCAYQLANTYSVLDKREKALQFYKEALRDKTLPVEYRFVCFLQLADNRMRNGDLKEARDLVKEGLAFDKTSINLMMLGSQILGSLNNYSEAIKLCKGALKFNDSKLKNNSINKNFDISINPQKILYQGLLLSLKGSDSKSFYLFLNELEKLNGERKFERTLILELMNNKSIDKNDIDFLKNIIDDENLEFYLILLSSYNKQQEKLSILNSLENRFNSNSKYLVQIGLAYYEKNDLNKAQEYFELSFQQQEKDPPAVFYLASIYLNTNNTNKLIKLIEFANTTFKDNRIVQEKLQVLIDKIKPLLENV